jgi:Fe-S oxidoreductase
MHEIGVSEPDKLSGSPNDLRFGSFIERCFGGDEPPCVSACPFGLNIRDFIGKVQRGRLSGAYSVYRDAVLFPAIVCEICHKPCMDVCVRKGIDDPIEVRGLEKSVVRLSSSAAPKRFNLTKKKEGIAVVGAGLCGLSCTALLASHGYDVTVYEKSSRIGGALWGVMPQGEFVAEIEKQMQFADYSLSLNAEICDIAEVKAESDAVLVATGKEGESFALLPSLTRGSFGSGLEGVFLAGGVVGAETPVHSIENGIRAAQSIESYLQTHRVNDAGFPYNAISSRLVVNTSGVIPEKRIEAAGEAYTKEEAAKEAGRCLLCDCEECMLACDMMRRYRKDAKAVVSGGMNTAVRSQETADTRMVSSCSDCGLCAAVCAERINLGKFLMETRRILHQKGSLPPAFHDYWIRDMEHARGDRAFLSKNAPGCDKSEYLFFPGCQLGASDPKYVENTYGYLLQKNPMTGLMLGCCGIPAEWAGDDALLAEVTDSIRDLWGSMGEPQIIFACPTCEKVFAARFSEIKRIALYDFMNQEGLPENHAEGKGETVSVFDPCSSRYDATMQNSVRSLLVQSGFLLAELPWRKDTARCCGNGGHIYSADPELARRIARNGADLGSHPYITYCTNCRDIFENEGKFCRHVLDVLFDTNEAVRNPPSLTERRQNRTRMKSSLLKKFWNEEEYTGAENDMKLFISPELYDRLNERLILEDDIREVIEYCEKTGSKMKSSDTGYYIGHLKQGILTYWVIYVREDDGYRVMDAYSHRVSITGE